MQNYIFNVVEKDDKLLYFCRLHWIYLARGAIGLILLAALGWWLQMELWDRFGAINRIEIPLMAIDANQPWIIWLFSGAGAAFFLTHLVMWLGTEIAVTDERIIFKRGIIFVKIEEIDLAEVRGEHVNLGMLGRFLGYGEIELDARFLGDVALPAVRLPYKLLHTIHNARKEIRDPLSV